MNKLSTNDRAKILQLLCEGVSIRAVTRVTGASKNTVAKLVADAGAACQTYHDEHVRGVRSRRVQVDEIWSFVFCKQKNVARAKRQDMAYGDVWTWTAIDADSKLAISWLVGGRDGEYALAFVDDLRQRLAGRVQLTSDGHKAYLEAVEEAFGDDVDYAVLQKLYGTPPEAEKRYSPAKCIGIRSQDITGSPDPKHVSTSYVERQNLTMRMQMRRFTRLTNAFSKKFENHVHMVALYSVWYNFVRVHKTLRMTPAMAAGVTDTLRDMAWIAELVEAAAPTPGPRGPHKKRRSS